MPPVARFPGFLLHIQQLFVSPQLSTLLAALPPLTSKSQLHPLDCSFWLRFSLMMTFVALMMRLIPSANFTFLLQHHQVPSLLPSANCKFYAWWQVSSHLICRTIWVSSMILNELSNWHSSSLTAAILPLQNKILLMMVDFLCNLPVSFLRRPSNNDSWYSLPLFVGLLSFFFRVASITLSSSMSQFKMIKSFKWPTSVW